MRLPALMRWPGHIPPGTVSHRLSANYDFLPTVAEIAGVPCPARKDGRSFLGSVLAGDANRQGDDYIVYASFHGPALVTADGWKLRYIAMNDSFQLYFLPDDYREEHDLAPQHPTRVEELREILIRECDGDLKYGHAQIREVRYR